MELSLRAQIILRSMLTLVLTVAPALLSVLQEQFLRVNIPTDYEKIKEGYRDGTSFLLHAFLFLRVLYYPVNNPSVLPTRFYLFRGQDML